MTTTNDYHEHRVYRCNGCGDLQQAARFRCTDTMPCTPEGWLKIELRGAVQQSVDYCVRCFTTGRWIKNFELRSRTEGAWQNWDQLEIDRELGKLEDLRTLENGVICSHCGFRLEAHSTDKNICPGGNPEHLKAPRFTP
jgi:hypothetical protein